MLPSLTVETAPDEHDNRDKYCKDHQIIDRVRERDSCFGFADYCR